jgi:hypothetical protein
LTPHLGPITLTNAISPISLNATNYAALTTTEVTLVSGAKISLDSGNFLFNKTFYSLNSRIIVLPLSNPRANCRLSIEKLIAVTLPNSLILCKSLFIKNLLFLVEAIYNFSRSA